MLWSRRQGLREKWHRGSFLFAGERAFSFCASTTDSAPAPSDDRDAGRGGMPSNRGYARKASARSPARAELPAFREVAVGGELP